MIQPRESQRVNLGAILSTPKGDHWMDKGTALCREVDPELFFPEQGDWMSVRRAKALCDACPLRDDCRKEAVANKEFGTWGGLSERERRGQVAFPDDTCAKGHDLSLPKARLNRGGCRECHNARNRRYDEQKRAERGVAS